MHYEILKLVKFNFELYNNDKQKTTFTVYIYGLLNHQRLSGKLPFVDLPQHFYKFDLFQFDPLTLCLFSFYPLDYERYTRFPL